VFHLILAMTDVFGGMALILHKSRVRCSGIMQWLRPLLCLQKQDSKLRSGLFYSTT